MKYNLVAIGSGKHRNVIPHGYQILYTVVTLFRYKDHDVIMDASEEEAIIVARMLRDGKVKYDPALDQYWIGSSGCTLKHDSYNEAACYLSWVNDSSTHIHFSNPVLFSSDHFELVEQDCKRKYILDQRIGHMTVGVPY